MFTGNSSNINEVIRPVLNFLFFFHDKILHAQKAQKEYKTLKSTKRYKEHKKTPKQKHKKQISEQKLKIRLKTSKWKKVTYLLICEEESLYNGNIDLTKLVKVLYEQKLVYPLNQHKRVHIYKPMLI